MQSCAIIFYSLKIRFEMQLRSVGYYVLERCGWDFNILSYTIMTV